MTTLLLVLIIALVSVVFALQNAFPVTVSFLLWQFDISLALLLLLTLSIGVLIAALLLAPRLIKTSWKAHSLQKKQPSTQEPLASKETSPVEAPPDLVQTDN